MMSDERTYSRTNDGESCVVGAWSGDGRTPRLCRGPRERVTRAMGRGDRDHEVSGMSTPLRAGTMRSITTIWPR
jgi:hypothetical protein